MESILTSIKKLLGIEEDYDCFDGDIMLHINGALSTLHQLGVGPAEGFSIEDASKTWDDFIPNSPKLNSVKTLVYLRVRLVFDPPTNSSLLTALSNYANELEWRLKVAAEEDNTKQS